MNLCFVTEPSLNNVWQERLSEISRQDVVVFGFNGLGLVSYKKELSGETEYFHDVAKLSKQLSSVVISGCDTDTYGIFRHSVVIAEKGKILGVSDMAHSVDESEFVPGGNYRVFETSVCKIGIIVKEDLFFPEASSVLSLCDADIIICIDEKQENSMSQVMLRASAFSNGVPMALCARGYSAAVDIKGNVISASSADIFKVKISLERDYHNVGLKRRGLYRDYGPNY
ncbi:MAG: carbon-nitrogen hydrolase family protein [Clostridia bacterium]|nr:carbon-nitrogen hydrolase family protein [Clostridia bacterium]